MGWKHLSNQQGRLYVKQAITVECCIIINQPGCKTRQNMGKCSSSKSKEQNIMILIRTSSQFFLESVCLHRKEQKAIHENDEIL